MENMNKTKRCVIVILAAAAVIAAASVVCISICRNRNQTASSENGTLSPGDIQAYSEALDAFHDSITADRESGSYTLTTLLVDLNGDNFKDMIYTDVGNGSSLFPHLALYSGSEFVEVEYPDEASIGSLFPSGSNSGFFFDADKGIIIIRYSGHTQGTSFYHAATASKITSGKVEKLWTIYSDEDKFASLGYGYDDGLIEECRKEFENVYESKTAEYDLENFFDVCR